MKTQAAVLVFAVALAPMASQAAVQSGAMLTVSNGITRANGIEIPGDVPLMLLRRSFAEVLKQGGLTLDGWLSACRASAPTCAQGVQGVAPVLAAVAVIQGTEARFDPVQAGTYYVFALGRSAADPVVWDLKVDLRVGPNALRLDERNHAAAAAAGAVGPAPATAPPPGQAPVGSAGDPSIAKARAAKVDTRVFGIPLGEPLRLPVCDALGGLFATGPVQAPPTCVIDNSAATALVTAFVGINLEDKDVATIQLSSESCPAWMSNCTVNAALREGNLIRVELTTKGRGVEQATGNELRGKYGAPTSSVRGTVTPDVGNPFPVTDLIWSLPGLRVEFQPVTRVEGVDDRVKTNEGLVRIETETSYQLRQKEVQEQLKPRL